MALRNRLIEIFPDALELKARYYYNRLLGRAEPELGLISGFAGLRRRAIDIGANVGIYSYEFSRYFARVESFEPNPHCNRVIRASRRPNLTLHDVALSDREGSSMLTVPVIEGEMATALGSLTGRANGSRHASHAAVGSSTFTVRLRTLDSYGFEEVDLIKVDVEGHELEVIEGARETIMRCRPTLMIEIEQRHHQQYTLAEIFERILALGYAGQFHLDGRFRPLKDFEMPGMQTGDPLGRRYINNFFFCPRPTD